MWLLAPELMEMDLSAAIENPKTRQSEVVAADGLRTGEVAWKSVVGAEE